MTVTVSRSLQLLAETSGSDPRGTILRKLGDKLDGLDVFHNYVLFATYVRPGTKEIVRDDGTIANLILGADKTRAEDRFQSKCGLVLKVGPIAFKDDNINKFGGKSVKPGDWIVLRTSDAFEFFTAHKGSSDGDSVRLIADTNIMGTIDDPEKVF